MILPTVADIRFRPDGGAAVDACLRMSARTHIHCCVYDDQAPVLAVDDAHVSVSLSVPDRHQVTPQDVALARRLADGIARYIAELENRIAAQDSAPAGDVAA
jgi:hypothetical protein